MKFQFSRFFRTRKKCPKPVIVLIVLMLLLLNETTYRVIYQTYRLLWWCVLHYYPMTSKFVMDNTTFTISSQPLDPCEIVHTIKTTNEHHHTRLQVLLATWLHTIDNYYLVTDFPDPKFNRRVHGRLVSTIHRCELGYHNVGLVCKMGVELDTFVSHRRRQQQLLQGAGRGGPVVKWWCHWDDDNYVNIKQLTRMLASKDWTKPWYVGRRSVGEPTLVLNRRGGAVRTWFATGGAGVCLSVAAVDALVSLVGDGEQLAGYLRYYDAADDLLIGLLVTHELGIPLTVSRRMYSHLNDMDALDTVELLTSQVSLSYGEGGTVWIPWNASRFRVYEDFTRFLSLHCLVEPTTDYCSRDK